MSGRSFLLVVVMISGLSLCNVPAHAGTSDWESVTVDKAAGSATFSVDFGHTPDFTAVDASGRLTDSFQILIVANPTGRNPFIFPTTVVRGDEIRFDNAVPVRDGSPAVKDPHSGGWGAVRGTVPFSVSGSEITFTAPLSLIGAPDGRFAYDVSTLGSGMTRSEAKSQSVPLPSALIAGMMMLVIGMCVSVRRLIAAR